MLWHLLFHTPGGYALLFFYGMGIIVTGILQVGEDRPFNELGITTTPLRRRDLARMAVISLGSWPAMFYVIFAYQTSHRAEPIVIRIRKD